MRFLSKITVLAGLACLIKMTYMGELGLLIHPRYFWLIYLSIAILCATFLFTPVAKSSKAKFPTLALTLFFIIGTLIDIQPLSSNAQQQVSNYISTQNQDIRNQYTTNFYVDTATLSLEELLSVFSVDPEPKNYEGKEVNLTGFYFENASGTPMIAKYILSCCAADARMVGTWLTDNIELEPDTWIDISGTLTEIEIEGIRSVGIQVKEYEVIETPKSPYVTN